MIKEFLIFYHNPKAKTILDFDHNLPCSIKSLAVNKNNIVKQTRFFNGKMLMFAKLSLVRFIYELIETFYFPKKNC